MGKQVIKIGTKVMYHKNGGALDIAKVTYIEMCKVDSKSGRPISSVPFDDRKTNYGAGIQYVFTLDNHSWCYGEQIETIVETIKILS